MTMAFPEFIVVELDINEFIIARSMGNATPPTYRKFLTCVGQPAADFTHASLMRDSSENQHALQAAQQAAYRTDRQVQDDLGPARVRIERNDEGVIQGARGAETDDHG